MPSQWVKAQRNATSAGASTTATYRPNAGPMKPSAIGARSRPKPSAVRVRSPAARSIRTRPGGPASPSEEAATPRAAGSPATGCRISTRSGPASRARSRRPRPRAGARTPPATQGPSSARGSRRPGPAAAHRRQHHRLRHVEGVAAPAIIAAIVAHPLGVGRRRDPADRHRRVGLADEGLGAGPRGQEAQEVDGQPLPLRVAGVEDKEAVAADWIVDGSAAPSGKTGSSWSRRRSRRELSRHLVEEPRARGRHRRPALQEDRARRPGPSPPPSRAARPRGSSARGGPRSAPGGIGPGPGRQVIDRPPAGRARRGCGRPRGRTRRDRASASPAG
jgi:hypothetical protein